VTTNTTHSAQSYLLKTMSYESIKDFAPIRGPATCPSFWGSIPTSGEFGGRTDRLAKRSLASCLFERFSWRRESSVATFARLGAGKKQKKIRGSLHVPYKFAPTLTDLIAGRVSMIS